MNKESIFAGLVGVAVGGGIGAFVSYHLTKKKYVSILKETTDNYEKLLDEAEAFDGEDDIPDEFKRYIPEEDNEERKISSEEKKTIREKLRFNNDKTTMYAKMYSAGDIIDAQAEKEDGVEPTEPDEDEETQEDRDEAESTNIFEAAAKSSNRKPVIISEEHYNDFLDNSSAWETVELFLYNDGTVTTADDKVIDEDELAVMLGDCLDKYGFRDSDEKMIYIQCFKLSTVYSIQKFNEPFND